MRPGLPPAPFLYPLTDRHLGGAGGGALARRLFASGARIVQLREKETSDLALLAEAREGVAAAVAAGGLLVVNDRVDVALLAGAHGVHLGGEDVPVRDARRLAGDGLLIGRSTHSVEEALRAAEEPLDYVALGPIYGSSTKPGRPPLGPQAIRDVRERSARPLVAIGGIGPGRLGEVVEAGADGVAVISAVIHPIRLEALTRALLEELQGTTRDAARGR